MFCHICWRLPQTDRNILFNPARPRQQKRRVLNSLIFTVRTGIFRLKNGCEMELRENLGREWDLDTHTPVRNVGIIAVLVNDFIQDRSMVRSWTVQACMVRSRLIRSWIINEYKCFKLCHFVFQKECFDEKMDKIDEVSKSDTTERFYCFIITWLNFQY
jgi:hypothetical protein